MHVHIMYNLFSKPCLYLDPKTNPGDIHKHLSLTLAHFIPTF